MRIQVTAQHIANGGRGLCTRCPVALAIEEHLPRSRPVVDREHIELRRHGRTLMLKTPWEVHQFVVYFDATGRGEPFEFELPFEVAA